ncbi:MAG TPA: N-acetylmuramoyl-L-alanine amidase [Symbiobacteriaceae bacterium]|jgi:N-acetylmuramoyl-L-alanine amidase
MKRILAGIVATASFLAIAAPALAHTAYPDGGVVNIRSGPGTNYSVLGSLTSGDKASVLSHEGSWLKVRTAGGLTGYMADWVTREVYDDEVVYVQVDTDVLNVRTDASADAPSLGQVRQGQRFHLLEGLGTWYKIEAGSLGTGWINGQYAFKVQPPPASQPPNTPPPDKPPGDGAKPGLVKAAAAAVNTTIYNGRSPDYAPLASVMAGDMLTYLDAAEGWVKVANNNGDKGWVNGTDLYLWDQGIDFSYQATYAMAENNWKISYLRVRQVVDTGDGLALRTGSTRDTAVKRSLHAGDRLKLLQVPDGEFVQVMVTDGTVGWVSRNWIKPVTGIPAEAVHLTQPQTGVQQLEITGNLANAAITATDSVFSISLPQNSGRKAGFSIAEHNIAVISLDASSLQLRFAQPFRYEVTAQTAGRLVVEFRPVVRAVDYVPGTDRVTYRFQLTGAVDPEVHRDGNGVVLNIPGARLQSGATAPGLLSLNAVPTGLTGRVVTDRPFAIKRGPGYLDLVFYASGLAGKTIVVDAGHGGSETGAVGPTGLMEKNANLGMALKLQKLLQAAGAKVIMTRTADVRCVTQEELALVPAEDQLRYDLNCRSVTANTGSADAFLSIHSNANPSIREQGTEVYWAKENLNAAQSHVLAGLFQTELVKGLSTPDRGVKDDVFYVIKYTDAPAALAEVAFVSNGWEEMLLKQDDFRQKAAESLFRALQQFFQ